MAANNQLAVSAALLQVGLVMLMVQCDHSHVVLFHNANVRIILGTACLTYVDRVKAKAFNLPQVAHF
jgi:energy-converting hydrogenase Eha subunit C